MNSADMSEEAAQDIIMTLTMPKPVKRMSFLRIHIMMKAYPRGSGGPEMW